MTPIQYESNSIRKTLEENQELAKYIREELNYLVQQHKHSRQRELLMDTVTFNLIKKYKEYDLMVDGRINTNDQPF